MGNGGEVCILQSLGGGRTAGWQVCNGGVTDRLRRLEGWQRKASGGLKAALSEGGLQ